MTETTNAEAGPMHARSIAAVYPGRYMAEMPDEFVVFLIGMRLNRPWKVHKWLPVLSAMPRMLRWLDQHPQAGLLSWHNAWINGPAVVQYWRSFAQLDRFARETGQPHLPTWKWFNREVGASGEVGIWHETYKVHAGEYECIYINMPRFGLAAAGMHTRSAPPRNRPHDALAPPTSTNRRSLRTPTPVWQAPCLPRRPRTGWGLCVHKPRRNQQIRTTTWNSVSISVSLV